MVNHKSLEALKSINKRRRQKKQELLDLERSINESFNKAMEMSAAEEGLDVKTFFEKRVASLFRK